MAPDAASDNWRVSASSRMPNLVIVATVAVCAWYAGPDEPRIGFAVAVVALSAAYFRRVLGIPAAIVMAALSVTAPHLVATLIIVAVCCIPVALLLAFAIGSPEQAGHDVSSSGGSGLGPLGL
jgi:hypothetical protein